MVTYLCYSDNKQYFIRYIWNKYNHQIDVLASLIIINFFCRCWGKPRAANLTFSLLYLACPIPSLSRELYFLISSIFPLQTWKETLHAGLVVLTVKIYLGWIQDFSENCLSGKKTQLSKQHMWEYVQFMLHFFWVVFRGTRHRYPRSEAGQSSWQWASGIMISGYAVT